MPSKRSNTTERLEAREALEQKFEIPADLRTQEIIFRLSKEDTYIGAIAKQIWQAMERHLPEWSGEKAPQFFELPKEFAESIDPLEWNALLHEIEDEKVRLGETTPMVKEFLESREHLNQILREKKEHLGRESIKVSDELMTEDEKKESKLFQELNRVVQDLAKEMGFKRPVILEITRSDVFNAYVLQVAKEGGMEKNNTVPLRLFINAGLIEGLDKLLKDKGKEPTLDHLAIVLAHEMAHLKQPGYNIDEPNKNREEHQRYEYDADTEALEAMDRAGYNPMAGIEFFEIMNQGRSKWKNIIGGFVEGRHPLTEVRIKELWQIYQRPDHPYFSAQKEPEPLSLKALAETSELLRHEFIKQIETAESLKDWDKIIERLEKDPKMTLRDAEIVGRMLRMHTDARVAIAGAVEELETNTGLAEAVLYVANHDQGLIEKGQKMYVNFEWMFSNGHSLSEPTIIDKPSLMGLTGLIGNIVKKESSENLRQEFDQRQARRDDELRFTEYIQNHGVGNEIVQNNYFSTVADLLDPNNEMAVAFWQNYFSQEVYKDEEAISDKQELIEKAKNLIVSHLAGAICLGVKKENSYEEEAIDVKEEFLKILKEVREGKPKEPGEAEAFGSLDLGKIKQRIAERLSTYRESTSRSIERPQYKSPRRELYSINTRLLNYPERIPKEALKLEAKLPEELTPLQNILFKYFQVARKIFEKTLSEEFIKKEYGLDMPGSVEARQMHFEEIFEDFFFDVPEANRRFLDGIDSFRSQKEISDYVRWLYSTPNELEHNHYLGEVSNLNPEFGIITTFFLGDDEKIKTPEELAGYLERVRTAAHHPVLKGILERNARNDSTEVRNKETPEKIRVIIRKGRKPFEIKKKIFIRYIQAGLGIDLEKLNYDKIPDAAEEKIHQALTSRAEGKNLPSDYYFWRSGGNFTSDLWTKLKFLFGTSTKRKEQKQYRKYIIEHISRFRREEQKAALNQILSEEFMRLMADDQEEIDQCNSSFIDINQATKL
jgi:hypothetical protein